MPKEIDIEFDSFFSDLASTLNNEFATADSIKDPMNFEASEMDHEIWGIRLNVRQRTLIKAFYSLPLEEEEIDILEAWTDLDRTTWVPNQLYQSLVVEAGRRGSKSSTVSFIVVYEFYRLCHLPNPQKHYKIASSTPISILVLATSAEQAKRTIFKQIVGTLKACRYFKPLIANGRIKILEQEIRFDDKLLYIYSGNSKSSGQVGQSAIMVVMDEVARFQSKEGESNALELWDNLGISGVTFGTSAKQIAISSAWEEKDAIQILWEKSKLADTWLGFRLRTWDLNPLMDRNNPVIAALYNTNPEKAALEFEGIRTNSVNRFLNPKEVIKCFVGIETIKSTGSIICEDYLVRNKVTYVQPNPLPIAIHLDPAITKDSYTLVAAHAELNEDNHTVVYIDCLMSWDPDPDKGATVSIINVQDCIWDINKVRRIAKLTSDHHNSSETIERVRQRGISAEARYFSNKLQLTMYDNLRSLMHEQRLILPRDSNLRNKLQDELCNLRLIKGIKIDHDPDGSKDIADGVAGVAWTLTGKVYSTNVTPIIISSNTSANNRNTLFNNSTNRFIY